MVQTGLEEKKLTLTFDTDCLVHAHVMADRLRLSPIFLNILDNSIKFTAAGGYIRFSVVEHDCPEPEISSIPIIAITANVFEEDKQRAMGANINSCIGKPLNIGKRMDILERILP